MLGEQQEGLRAHTVTRSDTIPNEDGPEETEVERSTSIREQSLESTDSHLEAPASSSQVYHAALLSNSTLDDILAAFEADRGHREVIVDRILVHRKPKLYLSDDQLDAMYQYKRQRTHGTSINILESDIAHHGTVQEDALGPPAQPSPHADSEHAGPRKAALKSSLGGARAGATCDQQRLADSTDSQVVSEQRGHKGQPSNQEMGSYTPERCPTHIRRHAQSLLHQRSAGGDNGSLTWLKDRGAMSTPVLPSSTPTKQRAKLQRKVRPKPSSWKT